MLRLLVLLPALAAAHRGGLPARSCRFGRSAPVRSCATNAVPWASLKQTLDDMVPVFVITDDEAHPLEYEVSGKSTLLCFAGVDGAQSELARARATYPDFSPRIQPVGLGTALERVREGRARFVAAKDDFSVAKEAFPEGAAWESGALPLFGCDQLQRRRPDGTYATMLFMSVSDAKEALAAADPERSQGLYLSCAALDEMVRRMESGELGPMDVLPPKASVEFCQAGMLGRGALVSDDNILPPGVTRGAMRRALPEILGIEEQPSSGLFPT